MNILMKVFLTTGVVFLVLGGLVFIYSFFGLEKLPGDIVVRKKNFTFIFPFMSMLVVSVVFNLLMRLWSKN